MKHQQHLQEKKIVFYLIRSFFDNKKVSLPANANLQQLSRLITITTMDGIAHQTLLPINLPSAFLKHLKKGHEAIATVDQYHKQVLDALKKTTLQCILIKEAAYKQSQTYPPGTRYSCDVDILITEETKARSDELLGKAGFLLNDIDCARQKELIEKAIAINKNVRLGPEVYAQQKKVFTVMRRKEEYTTKMHKKQLFSLVDKLTYFHKTGGMLDVHFRPCIPHQLYNIPTRALRIQKKGTFQTLTDEDALVINAGHFFRNFWKYKDPDSNYYQGYLKYIVDIEFIINKKNIDWQRVITLAKETNCSSNVWYYLHLAKQYLQSNIPSSVLRALRQNGSTLQQSMLVRINPYKLLFNEQDFYLQLYSRLYLEKTRSRAILKKMYHITRIWRGV
jgi:hypothetical protein